MKKILFILVVMSISASVFSQSWGEWYEDEDYYGLSYRFKRSTTYSGKAEVCIQIKNGYDKDMYVSWSITKGGESKPSSAQSGWHIGPGGKTNGFNCKTFTHLGNDFQIFIHRVNLDGKKYAPDKP